MSVDHMQYSDKYTDDKYEYRHVILPVDVAKLVPKSHLMTESEWRNLGVQQSPGWVHYMMHSPAFKKISPKVLQVTDMKVAESNYLSHMSCYSGDQGLTLHQLQGMGQSV